MSRYLDRIGPLKAGTFSMRRHYLAIYDDALVRVRLNPWESADGTPAVGEGGSLLAELALLGIAAIASAVARRRNKATLEQLAPADLVLRDDANWIVWAEEITDAVILRQYDVGNSRRLLISTGDRVREIRYSYSLGADERIGRALSEVLGTRFRLTDDT